MNKRLKVIIAAVAAVLITVTAWSAATAIHRSDTVRVIVLEGTITEANASSGITPKLIDKCLRQSEGYGAVVLRINSPGGTVVASQEILDKITRFKQRTDIPVVASIGEVGASGAYYISLGADIIVANQGSMTGSIGVVSQFLYIEGLLNKLGIETEIVKSGEHKDLGAGPMTERQREIWQGVSDDVYQQFVMAVATHRNMDIDSVEQLATGEIFTGRQALAHGLIDGTGSLSDAVSIARELGGLKGERVTIKYTRSSAGLLGIISDVKTYIINSIEGSLSLRWQLTP